MLLLLLIYFFCVATKGYSYLPIGRTIASRTIWSQIVAIVVHHISRTSVSIRAIRGQSILIQPQSPNATEHPIAIFSFCSPASAIGLLRLSFVNCHGCNITCANTRTRAPSPSCLNAHVLCSFSPTIVTAKSPSNLV